MKREDLFDLDTPPGHEDRVLRRAGDELSAARDRSRRRGFAALVAAFGGLVTAGLAFLYFRRADDETEALSVAEDVNALDVDGDLLADLPLEDAGDFEALMEDLDLLESEDV